MQRVLKIILSASFVLSVIACGNSSKEDNEKLTEIRKDLEKKKKEKDKLDAEIRQLEEQIVRLDSNASDIAKLVSIDTVHQQDFSHYIELQGKIDAENIAYVAPQGMGGVVKAVYVKLGQHVNKGQAILQLDNAVAEQAVIAARQSADVLKARLEQLKTIYEKRQNLWKQNIGSEIEVINAKADMDAMQSQFNAAEAGLKSAQELLGQTTVRAEISGVIDEMNIKPGEFFSPQIAAVRIVNNNNLKMVTGVPENYIARVKKGDSVLVIVPETGKPPYKTIISTIGASINSTARSFTTEAKLPSDPLLKPNQTASIKILDYRVKNTIVVPVNVVQTDEKGKYVYVMDRSGIKTIARKKPVSVGEVYDGQIEIKDGLKQGELIITEGYQNVYDGQAITTGI